MPTGRHRFRAHRFSTGARVPVKRWLLLVASSIVVLTAIAAANVRSPEWRKLREAISRGLPKTALESIDPLISQALARGSDAEAIRAITLKIALEAGIQGNHPEEKIRRMHTAIENAPPRLRPTMEAILADWYLQYFHAEQWRILQRTRTAVEPDSDFTTWDL